MFVYEKAMHCAKVHIGKICCSFMLSYSFHHFINVDFVFYCESFAYHDGGQDGEDVPDGDDEDVDGWMDGCADNL